MALGGTTRRLTAPGEARAWGWVAALRAGETVGWDAWSGTAAPAGRHLPGAQQLELLRRLNSAGRPGAELAERVLRASAPGRGSPDLELVGLHRDGGPRWGARPVDPGHLPDSELVRVAAGLLAEDVVTQGVPEHPTPSRRLPGRAGRAWRSWRTVSYRVVGDPWWADSVREHLTRAGRPPGGRRPTVLVLGRDLASMVADAYCAHAFSEGAPPWHEWLGSPQRRVPPRADLLAAVDRWSERVGRERVRVVLDPTRLSRALGTRDPLPEPPCPPAAAVHLAGRVAAPLALLVLPDVRSRLLRHGLLPRLVDRPGPPLVLPPSHHDWVRDRAEQMRESIRAAGYPVLGELDNLVPPPERDDGSAGTGEASVPGDSGVLDLAIGLLLEGPDRPAPGRTT